MYMYVDPREITAMSGVPMSRPGGQGLYMYTTGRSQIASWPMAGPLHHYTFVSDRKVCFWCMRYGAYMYIQVVVG